VGVVVGLAKLFDVAVKAGLGEQGIELAEEGMSRSGGQVAAGMKRSGCLGWRLLMTIKPPPFGSGGTADAGHYTRRVKGFFNGLLGGEGCRTQVERSSNPTDVRPFRAR